MGAPHPLDRPVWNALRSGWRALAEGDARARRVRPSFGPFAAAADDDADSLAALARLVSGDGEVWLAERDEISQLPGLTVARAASLPQMVMEDRLPPADGGAIALGDADAEDMRALALLTVPGPWLAETHRFGGFMGIRDPGGRLVAMAGERMKLDGFTEVSGVCTHPDHRGRGHAAALMRHVAARIQARGARPFLHAYAANEAAIALYERLGFRTRATMRLTVVTRPSNR